MILSRLSDELRSSRKVAREVDVWAWIETKMPLVREKCAGRPNCVCERAVGGCSQGLPMKKTTLFKSFMRVR